MVGAGCRWVQGGGRLRAGGSRRCVAFPSEQTPPSPTRRHPPAQARLGHHSQLEHRVQRGAADELCCAAGHGAERHLMARWRGRRSSGGGVAYWRSGGRPAVSRHSGAGNPGVRLLRHACAGQQRDLPAAEGCSPAPAAWPHPRPPPCAPTHLLALALPRRNKVLDQERLAAATAAGEEQVAPRHGQLLDALLLLAQSLGQRRRVSGGGGGARRQERRPWRHRTRWPSGSAHGRWEPGSDSRRRGSAVPIGKALHSGASAHLRGIQAPCLFSQGGRDEPGAISCRRPRRAALCLLRAAPTTLQPNQPSCARGTGTLDCC